MKEQFVRTEAIIGTAAVEKLQSAAVIVFGIGGVGSYVVEGLARAGVGKLTLVDNDVIDITNINRQLPALHSTVGKSKAETMANRVKDINPDCDVEAVECFFMPETADQFDFTEYDYVVDAIDTVTGKLALIEKAYNDGTPVISSMGTGNKLDPSMFKITAIEKTKVCPLAKVMRKELKNRNIRGVKVLYSEEEPIKPDFSKVGGSDAGRAGIKDVGLDSSENDAGADGSESGAHDTGSRSVCTDVAESGPARRKAVPGSISFVPSVAGLMIAGEIVRDLIKE